MVVRANAATSIAVPLSLRATRSPRDPSSARSGPIPAAYATRRAAQPDPGCGTRPADRLPRRMRARPIISSACSPSASWRRGSPLVPRTGRRGAPCPAGRALRARRADGRARRPVAAHPRAAPESTALRAGRPSRSISAPSWSSVASARPEARQLIGLVDGLVTVDVGALEGQAVGRATERSADYEVTLDLGRVSSRFGQRGISNVVLHELAHCRRLRARDRRLLATVDAGTPVGYGCENGAEDVLPREERFADSFAKWATGDIGRRPLPRLSGCRRRQAPGGSRCVAARPVSRWATLSDEDARLHHPGPFGLRRPSADAARRVGHRPAQ
jgi:hypothetical protein